MNQTVPDFDLRALALPEITAVSHIPLRGALLAAFEKEGASIAAIEGLFAGLAQANLSQDALAAFFHNWKATHLKMLAIYGLSCRL